MFYNKQKHGNSKHAVYQDEVYSGHQQKHRTYLLIHANLVEISYSHVF